MKKAILITLLLSMLSGCTEHTTMKAPCNATGSNCGPKIKINQWDN